MPYFASYYMLEKELVIATLTDAIDTTLTRLQQDLNDLKTSASNETKSTAGDKHETALAQLQILQARVNALIAQMAELKNVCLRNTQNKTTRAIGINSLFVTNEKIFYMNIAWPKIEVDGQVIYPISASSPLGSVLLNKGINEEVLFNNQLYKISKIE